jgi:hypothetical protein
LPLARIFCTSACASLRWNWASISTASCAPLTISEDTGNIDFAPGL